MMKTISKLFIFVFLLAATISCKPHKNDTITGGGKGGNITIRIVPEVYNYFVDTCMVYIKYGTLDAPANGIYDDSAVCMVTNNDTAVATFSNLTAGLYYFYGIGYHSIGGHPPNVKGAQNVTVSTATGNYLYYLPTYPYNL